MATNAAATAGTAEAPVAPRPRMILYPLTWQVIGAATLILGAGVLHFVYAPLHVAAARGQGIFFLGLGFLQVGWGAAALRNPSPRAYLVGMTAASIMPAVLYAVTRFVAAPFSDEAEGVDIIGAATFLAELGGALLLGWHGLRQGIEWRSPDLGPAALLGILAGAALLLSAALFGLGLGVEATVPWFEEGESTGHHGAASEGTGDSAAGEDHHATAGGSFAPLLPTDRDGKLHVQHAWLVGPLRA